MAEFLLNNYYLLNCLFAVGYSSVLLIYVGHFNPEDHRTTAFQRFLLAVVGWAFFDLIIWEIYQDYSVQTAFVWFRYLAFMFIFSPPLGCELVISLSRRVTRRDRVLLFSPFLLLYLALILFPEYVGPELFSLDGQEARAPAPWNMAFVLTAVGIAGYLLIKMVLGALSETEKAVRREKIFLFLGGVGTLTGIVASQVMAGLVDFRMPWMANLSTFTVILAAFWGLYRYGRVLSPRNIYKTILRVSPNGMIHFQAGRISWANQSMARMLGYGAPGDLLNRPAGALLYEAGEESGEPDDLAAKLAQGRAVEAEVTLADAKGRARHFLVNAAPFDPAEAGQGSLAVFTDISGQRRIQEEIRKRAKLEGVMEMSGAACHELNQPLQVIAGQLDLMQMTASMDDKSRERLTSIAEEMERLIRITKKIQQITRYRTKDYVDRGRIVDLEESQD